MESYKIDRKKKKLKEKVWTYSISPIHLCVYLLSIHSEI